MNDVLAMLISGDDYLSIEEISPGTPSGGQGVRLRFMNALLHVLSMQLYASHPM